MPVIDPALDAYARTHTTPPSPYLDELEAETKATLPSAVMLSGPVEGRLLQALLHAMGAERVLEIGTYSGYSALTMAEALPAHGRVITLELDPERAAFAQRHIDASPQAGKVEIRVGPALESIEQLEGPFDLVFIDADKQAYRDYYEASLPLLSGRGLIAVDNTLWEGEVLSPATAGESGAAIHAFNTHVASDPRVIAVIVPVRDGLTLIRRAP